VNQQRSQKEVPAKISQKPQVLKKPFAMGLLIISNFVSSDATERADDNHFSHLLATDVLIQTICWREMDSNLRWSGYFGFCQTTCVLRNRSKRGSAEDSARIFRGSGRTGLRIGTEPGRRSSANYRPDSTSKTRWAGGSRSAPIGTPPKQILSMQMWSADFWPAHLQRGMKPLIMIHFTSSSMLSSPVRL
jgi:hypothetical protein